MRTRSGGRPLSRRAFVQATVGAILAAASFPYPGLARVLREGSGGTGFVDPDGPDPMSFESGRVTAKDADSLTVTSPERTRKIRVQPGRTIYKEFLVSLDEVALGDSVMAKGDPQPDGSLSAWRGWVWVNIGVWNGSIVDLRPDGIRVRRHDGREKDLRFSARLDVIRAKKQVPVPEGTRALAVGSQVGAVIYGVPDGSLRATRIWIE